jgi:pimeloyl-ACP methyl ester carboxylesterase
MKYNPTRSKENLTSRLQYSLKKLETGKWTWKHDPKFIYSLDLGESKDLWKMLESIHFPTLVVKGEISKVTNDKDIEKMVKLLPNAQR